MALAGVNLIGFRAIVVEMEDTSLRKRPFVIAGGEGGRAVVWDMSPEALAQNIRPGMALAAAQRQVKDLIVVPPNPAACQKANSALEAIISRYAPVWQNDGCGNIFLDISGTRRLFGPPPDCVSRIQSEIAGTIGMRAAAAVASNKLVSKVASRAIRPAGFIEVRHGDEAAFLAHQDITLLPGIGQSLMKTIRVAGFREIWELAVLSDSEAIALFGGKKGILLRDAARGIDDSPVMGIAARRIKKRADFAEDVLDETVICGALASLAEHGGFEMRAEKLGTGALRLAVVYSDGAEAHGFEKMKKPLVMDSDIIAAADALYRKIVIRRIRIRSIGLCFEDLAPLGYQPDLFEVETESKSRRLQEAVDSIHRRYGAGRVMRGIVLAAGSR